MAMNEDSQKANRFVALLHCLDYITNHSVPLKRIIQLHPGHSFYQVPVLSNDNILSNPKPLVKTYPYKRMRVLTGTPTHVSVMGNLEEVIPFLKEGQFDNQQPPIILCKSVKDAI